MRTLSIGCMVLLGFGCDGGTEDPARPASEATDAPVTESAASTADPATRGRENTGPQTDDQHLRLNIPPRMIHRARQEAAGLYRMPRVLRLQTLEQRRDQEAPSYQTLRQGADAHAHARASFEGRVGFVRSAGPRLWILPLFTRQEGERWVDPLYVLSTIPTLLPPDGGVRARIDGWVVGDRTIGRNTLPLIVAYHVQSLEPDTETVPEAADAADE